MMKVLLSFQQSGVRGGRGGHRSILDEKGGGGEGWGGSGAAKLLVTARLLGLPGAVARRALRRQAAKQFILLFVLSLPPGQ